MALVPNTETCYRRLACRLGSSGSLSGRVHQKSQPASSDSPVTPPLSHHLPFLLRLSSSFFFFAKLSAAGTSNLQGRPDLEHLGLWEKSEEVLARPRYSKSTTNTYPDERRSSSKAQQSATHGAAQERQGKAQQPQHHAKDHELPSRSKLVREMCGRYYVQII